MNWRNRIKASIDDSEQQAVELQTLRAYVENQEKVGDFFYKMDEEIVVTIWEELSGDFFSLAESHLGAVRRLVERLDDDHLGTQLQFERYERECQKQEGGKRATTITICDEGEQEKSPNEANVEQ